jgi:heme-degrading monooxygenase HmoA
MSVARLAIFDEPPLLHDDDQRRVSSLRELVQSVPGFIGGYELRDAATGRPMSVTLWESEAALEAGEHAVRNRSVSDRRGIRAARVACDDARRLGAQELLSCGAGSSPARASSRRMVVGDTRSRVWPARR